MERNLEHFNCCCCRFQHSEECTWHSVDILAYLWVRKLPICGCVWVGERVFHVQSFWRMTFNSVNYLFSVFGGVAVLTKFPPDRARHCPAIKNFLFAKLHRYRKPTADECMHHMIRWRPRHWKIFLTLSAHASPTVNAFLWLCAAGFWRSGERNKKKLMHIWCFMMIAKNINSWCRFAASRKLLILILVHVCKIKMHFNESQVKWTNHMSHFSKKNSFSVKFKVTSWELHRKLYDYDGGRWGRCQSSGWR